MTQYLNEIISDEISRLVGNLAFILFILLFVYLGFRFVMLLSSRLSMRVYEFVLKVAIFTAIERKRE